MLAAVARGTGSAALWAVATGTGTALGVAHALVSPVLDAGRGALDTALMTVGRAPSGPQVVWSQGRRAHLDIRALLGSPHSPRHDERVDGVLSATRTVPGVACAHVEVALGRLIVACAPDRELEQVCRRVLDVLAALDLPDDHHAAASVGESPDESLAAHVSPGDRSSVVAPAVAAAMDVVAVTGAVAGQLARLPAAPRAARAAVAVVQHQPRLVRAIEARLGRVGTDVLLTAAAAAAHGFGQAPAAPLLDLAQRVAQIGEALAHREAWAGWEPVLAVPTRPRAVTYPAISGGDRELDDWAGPTTTVATDSEIDSADNASGSTVVGEIESYLEQAASGTLVAAAGALLAGGGVNDIAGAVLAGVPKAAHLGRESFASVLGRGLARTGSLVLDAGALRRLDRIKVVVIDGAALRGDARMVLQAEGRAPGWDDDRVYEVADALLHHETPPDPDPDERPANGARLRWTQPSGAPGPAVDGAGGGAHAQLVVAGQVVGLVEVCWEPDPYALALVETARRTETTVVLRHGAGTSELATAVRQSYSPDTPLSEVVRTVRAERGPVMLISALHPDLDCDDIVAAFAQADVSVALDDPAATAAWNADIVTGATLLDAIRLLSALPAARRASAAAVRLAKAGSTLEGLLVVTGGPSSRLSISRWFSPVHATAAIAMIAGALSARGVLGLPDPDPVPLTAWHALDAEVVFARLTGGRHR
jgi:cation-transporting ATPase I